MDEKPSLSYRRDIDGLRAIAVVAVILFHFGFLPNGYLGVDVFFVISGYLITKIVYNEVLENRFSITRFYLRRIRRIIPLVLFTTLIVLITALCVMLPDDLENLSQSVVATNCFANNILLLITTGNYWDVVNEYKPLMHTWSLGIEEQFYLAYPLVFLALGGKRIRWIQPFLWFATLASLCMFLVSSNEPSKFYSIQFRFFELSTGGLGAIILRDRAYGGKAKVILTAVLLSVLLMHVNLPNSAKLFVVVLCSMGILIPVKQQSRLGSLILENRLLVGLGKISFSLYMWHQIVLAFTRYFITSECNVMGSSLMMVSILLLSILSYYCIEQPFRNKKRVKTASLLWTTSMVFALTTCFSLYVYAKSGVLKDVPELELVKSNAQRGMHSKYNSRIRDLDKDFTDNGKVRVLVIGNSFARDWANILLESKYGARLEISYVEDMDRCGNLKERISKAKYVFFSMIEKAPFNFIARKYDIDTSKVWNVGTKNFGSNNGIFYNKQRNGAYYQQRTSMDDGVLATNDSLKQQWGDRYIDLIGMIIDKSGTVPVFTPECKFISQDCRHLTHGGAVYFGQLLGLHGNFRIE